MLSDVHLRFATFNSFRLGFHIAHYYSLLNILVNLNETEPKFEEKLVAFQCIGAHVGNKYS